VTISETTDARPDAVGAPVERPVRPSLAEALDAWWEAAFAEGRDGRDHDTEGGAAQTALQDIWSAHSAALAAVVAAERERWRDLLLELATCKKYDAGHNWVRLTVPQRLIDRMVDLAGPNAECRGSQRP